VPNYAASLTGDVRGLRIGVPQEDALSGVSEDVLLAIEEASRTLAGLGAMVVEVAVPWLIEATVIWPSIAGPEAAHYHRQHLEQTAGHRRAGAKPPPCRAKPARHRVPARPRRAAPDQRRGGRPFRRHRPAGDPATHVTAFPIEVEPTATSPEGRLHRFTAPFDITGQPAISVPCGFDPQGLPIASRSSAVPGGEKVLRAAHAYEQATDWHKARPNL